MERALLHGLLLLLLLLPGRTTGLRKGEMCRVWMHGAEPPAGPFQCPRASDRAEATFCCGTCRLPFCCPSPAARLDQKQCAPTGQWKTTPSGHQVDMTTKHLPRREAWVQYVWAALLAITASFICVCVLCIAFRIKNPLRIRRRTQRTLAEELPPEVAHVSSNPSLDSSPSSAGASTGTDAAPPGAEDSPGPCEAQSASDKPSALKLRHLSSPMDKAGDAAALPAHTEEDLPCQQPRKRNRHFSG